jgi:hypothetical protein
MKIEGYDLEEMPVVDATGVGFVSLVAYFGGYPRPQGNYFTLNVGSSRTYEIANMWYENLQYLIDDGTITFPIKMKILTDRWAIVYDDRVPRDFYTDTSYRAPKQFWSLTEQANRQLDIDTGKLKITTLESGMTVESRHVESKTAKLRDGVTWTTAWAPYVPVFDGDVALPNHDGLDRIKEMIVDPKYYGTLKLTGDADMKQVIIRGSDYGNRIVVDNKVISSFDRDTSQDDALDAVISLCRALGVEISYEDGDGDEEHTED